MVGSGAYLLHWMYEIRRTNGTQIGMTTECLMHIAWTSIREWLTTTTNINPHIHVTLRYITDGVATYRYLVYSLPFDT